MSEHQYIAFRAIDRPVSEKDLEFMRRQSSRAEVTPWSFNNEYQYGDFRGDALEMLRRGYDLHLHYANYGVRKLLIRLPQGIHQAATPYLAKDSLQLVRDKQGPGATLSIQPFLEPGELEELWDCGDMLDRLAPLRAEILAGDLRPLYLAHLAIACDGNHDPEKTKEAPVPASLDRLTNAQQALTEWYGLSHSLIAAAAQGGPTTTAQADPQIQHAAWLQAQPEKVKDAWLAHWLADPHSAMRSEILAEFQKSHGAPPWPTIRLDRTIAALQAAAEAIQQEADRKSAAQAACQQAKRLAEMAAAPARILRETEELIAQHSTNAYQRIATLLADLREALAGTKQAGLAEQQARKLKEQNPTLRKLTSELRKQGFVLK